MSLLDKASLVVTPNAYKESKLYSVIPNTTLGDMDVVRATTATRINSAGLVEVMPRNLLTYSEQIDNADWVKSNTPTITTNIAVAPNGTMTADGIQSPSGTNYKVIYQTKTISPNSTLTYSLYVKKETSETNFGGIGMYLSGGSIKSFYVIINAVTGTLVLTANSITPTLQVVDAGAYWRIIATVIDNGNNTSVIAEYYATISTNGTTLSPASGSVRTLWGFQLETSSTATEYFPTTTRLNIPRIDYTNGSCPSLLVEPQRSNLLTYSEQFDDASWSKAAITVTANSIVSPSGVQNADTFTTSAYPSTSVGKNNTLSATNHTLSCYVKAGSVSTFRLDLVTAGFALGSNCIFNLNTLSTTITNYGTTTGSTATITSVGNGWYRCTLTVLTTAVVYFSQLYPAANGSVYAWGVQLEASSYATSYIPTVASSVTRNADVISKSGISSLIGQTEGTLFCDVNLNTRASYTYLALSTDLTTSSNYLGIAFLNNAIAFESVVAAALQANISYSNSSTGRFKIAAGYKANDFVLYINGVQIGVDTSGTVPACSQLGLTAFSQTAPLNYNSVQVYKTKLSNTELAQLTTL